MHTERSTETRFGKNSLQRFETADPSHFGKLLASVFRAVKKEQHRRGSCAVVPPSVARAVLDDDDATFKENGLRVIKFQPNLTFINYGVVDGVRLVHCWIFFFKVIGQPSETNQSLAGCSFTVKRWVSENGTRRKSNEVKACATRPWNDGVGITVEPLLLAKVRSCGVYPNKRVLVVGYALELICQQLFVTADDGLAVYVCGDNTSVCARSLAALGRRFS